MRELEFFTPYSCAKIVRDLFDRKELWESRMDRKTSYRNGDWFTLGSSLYLDLKAASEFNSYKAKVKYFNEILVENFSQVLSEFQTGLLQKAGFSNVRFLTEVFEPAGMPGFHIFPPHETLQSFFGKVHQDRQWTALLQMPDFPFKQEEMKHFSFTIALALPFLGGGMVYGGEFVPYTRGHLYLHDGLTDHYIAPFKTPVLPMDWRITLQAHGFKVRNTLYLYW